MERVSILSSSGSHSSIPQQRIAPPNGPRTSPGPQRLSITSLSFRQKLVIFSIGLGDFFAAACYSLIAPFFPKEGHMKGATQTEVGLIVGVYQLTGFIISPLIGKYLTVLGSKFIFISGMFIGAVCTIIFGFLNLSPPGATFVALCFVVRIFQALGQVAFLTASFAIIANEFPGQVSTVFGILETFFGVGLMAGPPIGGALYGAGGFKMPFVVIGACLLVTAIVVNFVLPTQHDSCADRMAGYSKLLRIPGILVTMVTFMAGAISIGFLEPTLAPFLEQFSLAPAVVGLVFLVNSAMYAIFAPLWGKLGDKLGCTKVLMMIGTAANVLAFIFIAPAPFIGFKTNLWVVILCLVLQGLAIGGQLVPSLLDMLRTASWHGLSDDYATYGLVSGIFNAFFSLGAFIGPTVGGIMDDYIGFAWSAVVISGLEFLTLLLLLVYAVFHYREAFFGEPPEFELSTSLPEREPLLTKNASSTFF